MQLTADPHKARSEQPSIFICNLTRDETMIKYKNTYIAVGSGRKNKIVKLQCQNHVVKNFSMFVAVLSVRYVLSNVGTSTHSSSSSPAPQIESNLKEREKYGNG